MSSLGRLLCLGLLLLGCGADESDPTPESVNDAGVAADAVAADAQGVPEADAAPTAPWIEIGTGVNRFEPLTPGQEVPIIEGIQGGYHVWGAVRGDGFSGLDVILEFELTLGDKLYATARYAEPVLPRGADGVIDYAKVAVIYLENGEVGSTSGETLILSVRVINGDGLVLDDQIAVVPDCCELPTGLRTDPPPAE